MAHARPGSGSSWPGRVWRPAAGGVWLMSPSSDESVTLLDGDWDSFGLTNEQSLAGLDPSTYGGSSVEGQTYSNTQAAQKFTTVPTKNGVYLGTNNNNCTTFYDPGVNPFTTDWSGTYRAYHDLAGNTGRYTGFGMGMQTGDVYFAMAGCETYDGQCHVYVNTVVGGARSNTAASASRSTAGTTVYTITWTAATRVLEIEDDQANTASLTLTAAEVAELDDRQNWGFAARRGDWDTANVIETSSFATS